MIVYNFCQLFVIRARKDDRVDFLEERSGEVYG